MPLDYSKPRTSATRTTVNKNRPKKRVAGVFVLAILGALAVTFAAGVLTGWFVFRHSARKAAAKEAVTAGQQDVAPAPGGAPLPGDGRVQEPSLTFYETLPKGGKAVIGTGLNPKREEASPAAQPAAVSPARAPQPQAPVQPAAVPPAPAKAAETKQGGEKAQEAMNPSAKTQEKESAAKKPALGKVRFSVQVASYKDRKDAEAVRAKAAARGLDAYIVESNVPDKGVWYRVRVGKHLEQVEANEVVKKAGKGAIVIAE